MPGLGFGFGFAGINAGQPGPQLPGQEVLVEQYADEDDTRREVNAVLTDVVPWLVSLFFHLAIVILAFFTVWATIQVVDEEKIVIPVATLSDTPGVPLSLVTPQITQQEASSSRRAVTQNLVRPTSAVKSEVRTPTREFGVAGSQEAIASPFGTGPRPGEGLGVGFFGTGGNARSIVYIIDAGGMMIDTMPFVLDELKRSINSLSEQQKFNVIFFPGGKAFEVPVPSRGLKEATPAAKQAVIEWIDLSAGNVRPQGQPNPIEAIQMGLRYQPELVYLLSADFTRRGKYAIHPDDLLKAVREANKKPSKINTIQFVYPDPLVPLGRKATMQQISEETGGVYKFVDGRELGGR